MSHERIIPVYRFNSNYIPSSECTTSIRPSRAPSESEDGPSYIAGKLSEVTSSSGVVVTVDLLLKSLQQSGLPGPVILVGRRTFLGQGAQFTVHEETMAWPEFDHFSTRIVATKQPIFALQPNLRVNMAEPHVQANLRDVYLEILALTDPALRMHPNVVRLLAWSFKPSSFHAPFNLVMEIASCNLSKFISNAGVDLSLRMKYWLCRDVGAGLDALHECGIVHGDIKPDNILIFGEGNRAVAKIADFGGSVYGDLSENSRIRLGGTLGWQASEVEENKTITPAQLSRTDNYSFGLLIWGVLLNDGKVPCRIEGEHRQITYNREMETKGHEIGLNPGSFTREAAFVLLHQEPEDRPFDVKKLFGDITPEASPTKSPLSHPAFRTDLVIESLEDASRNDSVKGRYLSWELPAFAYHFLDDLYSRFMQDSRSVPADVLFSMYLAYTHTISRKAGPSNQALGVLVASALNGYEPAQATVTDAYEFYRLDPPEGVNEHLLDWLERATASGSIQAKRRLQNLDLEAVCRSMKDFRTFGGYNRI
ncbi:hypothetical protein HYALB_00002810 [Hymenoscyphus albidus]|uniref:Protein kinase domain-containing protein n=1 Tax=Hymenoscyphus albidus TaxID=595503 RepID=A0A9N9PZ46_9HELO|nr:hypothetical protein HYALB_00002810 [Hymenoscyphus albidus]